LQPLTNDSLQAAVSLTLLRRPHFTGVPVKFDDERIVVATPSGLG
jgi:hypothetical protein